MTNKNKLLETVFSNLLASTKKVYLWHNFAYMIHLGICKLVDLKQPINQLIYTKCIIVHARLNYYLLGNLYL